MMAEDCTACNLIPDCLLCPERDECMYGEVSDAI